MSGVDWDRYNLPAIWSLISDVDVCTGSDRVLAWDGLATEMRDQHKRLLAAADRLAAVWPPERNESAKFFLQQVNGLADSMRETLQRAEDTKAGLQGVIGAFSTAQEKVRELAAGREAVGSDWMPRFVDHAEDKYDQHAQAAMREAESAIEDHGSQIQAPALFHMDPAIEEDGHHLTADDGKSAGLPPDGGSRAAGLHATPRPVPVDSDPNGVFPDSPAHLGSGPSHSADGPVLSGIATPPPIEPGGSGPGPLELVPGGGTAFPPSNPFGGVGGGAPGLLPIGDGFGGDLRGDPGNSLRQPVSVRRTLPSGAVIGEGAERESGGSRSGVAPMMPMGGAGGHGTGRRNSTGTSGARADQQWQIKQGVVPVIKPDLTQVRHDPGPGVIGFDR